MIYDFSKIDSMEERFDALSFDLESEYEAVVREILENTNKHRIEIQSLFLPVVDHKDFSSQLLEVDTIYIDKSNSIKLKLAGTKRSIEFDSLSTESMRSVVNEIREDILNDESE